MANDRPIYLDNNATTRVDPRVLAAMLPYLSDEMGNAASRNHVFGRLAREAVQRARGEVAALIGASGDEIVWTSGATESDNLAVQGAARMHEERGRHLVTTTVEHKAVLDACHFLERQGHGVTYVCVDRHGRVEAEKVGAAIRADTVLVSVMAANNELGTLNPVADIGRACKERGVLLHCDATQAIGKVPVNVEAMGVDLLSISGHKLHGPKGVGALYVRQKRPRVRIAPLLYGGGHEDGLRSGTLNVPGIVGLGAACALARAEMTAEAARIARLRDRLWEGLQRGLGEVVARNSHPRECLPNTLNVRFDGVEGDRLIFAMPGLAISSGSACTTSSLEPSYVLRAIGLRDDQIYGSLRFSLGRFNTEAEIDAAIAIVVNAVTRVRVMTGTKVESSIEPGLFDAAAARRRRAP